MIYTKENTYMKIYMSMYMFLFTHAGCSSKDSEHQRTKTDILTLTRDVSEGNLTLLIELLVELPFTQIFRADTLYSFRASAPGLSATRQFSVLSCCCYGQLLVRIIVGLWQTCFGDQQWRSEGYPMSKRRSQGKGLILMLFGYQNYNQLSGVE